MRVAWAIVLVLSCGPTGGPGEERSAEAAGGESRATSSAAGATSAATGDERIVSDWVAEVDRLEVFEREARVLDLGTRAGAKYTLGGWETSVVADAVLDESSVAIVRGRQAKIALPWDGDGAVVLRMRAAVARPTTLRLAIDGEEVGQVDVAGARLETILFRILPIAPGEHTLTLRVGRTGEIAGVRDAGLAIDWIRIGPAAAAPGDSPPPSLLSSETNALALGNGHRIGMALEIPAGARFRTGVLGAGAVTVTAHRDGAPPTTLARGRAGERIDADLASLAGGLARIDVATTEGEVVLAHPRVVVAGDGARARELPRPRNVVVYLIDTLRADKLPPFNPSTRVRAPGLVAFAQRAATLTRAHSQENWTKPSVATLLSGLMPWQHTAVDGSSVVPQTVALLPEMLEARGFETGAFIANGYVSDAFGFRRGWGTYRNYIREGSPTAAPHVAGDVLSWLDARQAERDERFFLYVHAIDPHVPYRPPAEYLAMYDAAPYSGPVSFRRDATLLENVKLGRLRLGARDRERLEALYDGEITYHDVHFAAILDGLERRGLADETLVVVTSDHGEEFWDHGSVGHGHSVYEELLHVPLLVRWPGVTDRAAALDAPVGLVDVVPTVLEILGEPVPDGLPGRSLVPLLAGEADPTPRASVSGFMSAWRAIVVGRTKLIQRGADRFTLYDLTADPREANDLATERPIAVRHARGLLGLVLAATGGEAEPAERRRGTRHSATTTAIDAETRAQLRALGYIVE